MCCFLHVCHIWSVLLWWKLSLPVLLLNASDDLRERLFWVSLVLYNVLSSTISDSIKPPNTYDFLFTKHVYIFSMSGSLEFYDVNEVTCMNVGEHFTATDVEWDPSGRYVSTSVSYWAQKVRLQLLGSQQLQQQQWQPWQK